MKISILVISFLTASLGWANGRDLRVGIIGCDTSHATAFTETLNNPEAKGHVAGAKVVAAFKGGSPDIPSSANRVEEYASTLQKKYGVRFYDHIEDMCRDVDAILLESVDGRPHLAQFKAVLRSMGRAEPARGATRLAGFNTVAESKPVFIDKPLAASLKEGREIFRLAREAGVPVFSSSALRFAHDTQSVRSGSIGRVQYVEAYGPCELEKHHPDLFWYGIHGVEALFTILGPDCLSVQRGKTDGGKIEVTGMWSGGRRGVFRENKDFHGLARGEKGESKACSFDGYLPLVQQIVEFFQTRQAPVEPQETLQILAFMEAADASLRAGGKPIALSRMH